MFYSRALSSHSSLREAAAVRSWFLLDFPRCWEPAVRAMCRGSFTRLSAFLLARSVANPEKKTAAWPTKLLRHKRLRVRKMNLLMDAVWQWKALAQFIASCIWNRELFPRLVLTPSLLSLLYSRDWFLAITWNVSCLPSPEVLSWAIPILSSLIFFW